MSQDKIIKFFDKQSVYSEKEGTNIGVYVDTETTGLEDDAEITEICLLPFSFTDDMEICKVFKPYNGFEQPSKPLSDEIKSLTGLTDEDLEGKHFEDHTVTGIFNKAEIAIAHNASFDRRKIERRFPSIKKPVWCCSAADPDWGSMHIKSKALDYIAFRLGFWFDHHRAENDCRAGLHVLSHSLPTGKTAFQSMVEKAFSPETKLYVKSRIEHKDILKSRGYRWDAKDKQWWKGFDADDLLKEEAFLHERLGDVGLDRRVTDIKRRYA